jgi:glycosyltransferase involved in cell wall biosynthesis
VESPIILKKVLIISYAFPPVGSVGVQRCLKFVKYLRYYGWEPIVLTVENPSVPIIDISYFKDIPAGVKIVRAATAEPSYAKKKSLAESMHGVTGKISALSKKVLSGFLLPDVQVLWWPKLIPSLISLIKSENPQCIFVTAPPFSSFIPVIAIGRLFKKPVIADFRDEWSFSREQWENTTKTTIARKFDRFLEKYVVLRCAAITATTQSYIDSLHRHYCLPTGKCTAITNGFDEDDFRDTDQNGAVCNNQRITLIYTGTVWNANSLRQFIAALDDVIKIKPAMKNQLRLRIFGRIVDSELLYLKSPGLESIVGMFGYLEHEKVIQEMIKADLLLLVISNLPGTEKIIVAKTFEYMATGKHIFALVPDGETKNLLSEKYGNVTFAKPDDVEDIKQKLCVLLDNIDEIRSRKGKNVSQFSRKRLTGKLAAVLNRVAKD